MTSPTWQANYWCFIYRLVNVAPGFSVARWLTVEAKDFDWFGQLSYIQYWVVFFIFLTFECWVLTMGNLQAVCVRLFRMSYP
jgi:hypothetical protein